MNRLESLLIMCLASDKIRSFNYYSDIRSFSCFTFDGGVFCFGFNSTLTEISNCKNMYEELLIILKEMD